MPYTEDAKLREIMDLVYDAEKEMGYNPIDRIANYLETGDPTYITGKNNARQKIFRIERDDIINEFLKMYFRNKT